MVVDGRRHRHRRRRRRNWEGVRATCTCSRTEDNTCLSAPALVTCAVTETRNVGRGGERICAKMDELESQDWERRNLSATPECASDAGMAPECDGMRRNAPELPEMAATPECARRVRQLARLPVGSAPAPLPIRGRRRNAPDRQRIPAHSGAFRRIPAPFRRWNPPRDSSVAGASPAPGAAPLCIGFYSIRRRSSSSVLLS